MSFEKHSGWAPSVPLSQMVPQWSNQGHDLRVALQGHDPKLFLSGQVRSAGWGPQRRWQLMGNRRSGGQRSTQWSVVTPRKAA